MIYPCGCLTSKIFDFTGFYRLVVFLSDSLVLWLCGFVLGLVRCLCKIGVSLWVWMLIGRTLEEWKVYLINIRDVGEE